MSATGTWREHSSPACPHVAPTSCFPDGGSSLGWGGDSGSPGGGQHQHPHKGATPNRVLTHALGRGQQNRWESKQAGWALLIRHRQAAGRTLLEHWCWSPAVPCEAAALPAEPRLSIDCRHVGCLSRGAASGLLADARERCGGDSAGSSATTSPALTPPTSAGPLLASCPPL